MKSGVFIRRRASMRCDPGLCGVLITVLSLVGYLCTKELSTYLHIIRNMAFHALFENLSILIRVL